MRRLFLLLLLLMPFPALADWYVNGTSALTGSDSLNEGLAFDSAYFTISKPLDLIDTYNLKNQTIWVACTTYPEIVEPAEQYTTIIADTNGIYWAGLERYATIEGGEVLASLVSWNIQSVSISGLMAQNSIGAGFYFQANADGSSISDCYSQRNKCGYIWNGASNTVMSGCIGRGNNLVAPISGYGEIVTLLGASNTNTLIEDSTFFENSATTRSMICCGGTGRFEDCSFSSYSAPGSTYMLYFTSGPWDFFRCKFEDASASFMSAYQTTIGTIESCLFKNSPGGAFTSIPPNWSKLTCVNSQFVNLAYAYVGQDSASSAGIFYNCAFVDMTYVGNHSGANSLFDYCSTWNIVTDNLWWGAIEGPSNIVANPVFCDSDCDYVSALSPWFTAGTGDHLPEFDFNGVPFATTGKYAKPIGAFAAPACGYTPTPTPYAPGTPPPTPAPTVSPVPTASTTPSPVATRSPTPVLPATPYPSRTPTPVPPITPTPIPTLTPWAARFRASSGSYDFYLHKHDGNVWYGGTATTSWQYINGTYPTGAIWGTYPYDQYIGEFVDGGTIEWTGWKKRSNIFPRSGLSFEFPPSPTPTPATTPTVTPTPSATTTPTSTPTVTPTPSPSPSASPGRWHQHQGNRYW